MTHRYSTTQGMAGGKFFIDTSGWSYRHPSKAAFYPPGPAGERLSYSGPRRQTHRV